jgi:TRAP-type C4-dicarboxylate transport system substrate-binding protein
MFAADVERRTRGGLKFSIYPNASLMAPNAQFAALRGEAFETGWRTSLAWSVMAAAIFIGSRYYRADQNPHCTPKR